MPKITHGKPYYLNSIHTIDQMGEFIMQHQAKKGDGTAPRCATTSNRVFAIAGVIRWA